MKTNYIQKFEEKSIFSFLRKKKIYPGQVVFIAYKYKNKFSYFPYNGKFLGICIGVSKNSLTTKIHLRNVFGGEGVEFKCYIYTKNIVTISIIKMKKGKYNKSKLYYLRKRVLWQSTILYKSFLGI